MKRHTKRDVLILLGVVALVTLAAVPSVSAQGSRTVFHMFGYHDSSHSPADYFTSTEFTSPHANPNLVLPPGDYEAIFTVNGTTCHTFQVGGSVNQGTSCVAQSTAYLNFTVPQDETYPLPYWCVPHKGLGMAGNAYKTQSDADNATNGGGGGSKGSPGFTTVGAVAGLGIAFLVLQRRRDQS